MADNLHITDYSKPIYLHNNLEKFWEIKLDPTNYKASIRCGKLESNGREDTSSIQTLEKSNTSWGEAIVYAEKHIKMKISKGYDFLERNNQQPLNVNFSLTPPTQSSFHPTSPSRSNISAASAVNSSNGKRRPDEMLPKDDQKQMKKDNGRNNDMEDDLESVLKSIEAKEKFEANERDLGEYTQKAYRVENLKDSEKNSITDKAMSLELICDCLESKVVVAGYQSKIDIFVDYLKKFLTARKKADSETKKEIPLSSAMVKAASYIEQKGIDLGLLCEVHEKSVVAVGPSSKITELENYIKDKEKELSKAPPAKSEDNSVKKEISLTAAIKRNRSEVEKKADQLGVFCEFTDTKLIFLGSNAGITDLLGYLFELEASPAKEKEKEKTKDGPGEYTQKDMKMTKAITDNLADIKKKAEELELILDIENDKFLVAGFEKKIDEFKKYIENAKEKPKQAPPTSSATGGSGDMIQKEISISTFHRYRQKEIEKKAEEMGLYVDFGYDVVLVTGTQSNIGLFIAHLYEVESAAKKSLYPKYWDFHEVSAFSMANVAAGTEEFKEVERLFYNTMQGHRILKLERIQNKYLMDHYVTNICKRLEIRPKDLNRMLLFHGTRTTKPDTIYKNFDTGFDLQYANHGAYGKGLYFAVGASYSHGGFVYRTTKGTFQLLIADVFVGKAKNSGGGNYIKAPDGYDSISANGGFYIIYNNFHSYPLYLLEYK